MGWPPRPVVGAGALALWSVEETLDVAADLLKDREGCPDVHVAVGQAPRLTFARDRVVDAIEATVENVVLAENAGIVGPV